MDASIGAVTANPRAGRPVYDLASLVEVAVGVFNERGYDATSMEDLSRAAGITKSSFYHHVAGKEALLRAALERAIDGLFGILDEPGARLGAPIDRLRHVVAGQVGVLAAELPYVTLLLRVRGNTETERWALERRRAFDGAVAALLVEAVDAGEIRDDVSPAVAARLLSGTVNSLVEWYRPDDTEGSPPTGERGSARRPGRESASRLADDLTRVTFEGLVPRA